MIEREENGRTDRGAEEPTAPLWRVAAVMLVAGSIAALGFYLQRIGHADDFATVVVIATAYTVMFWARKRPDRVRARFGPFGKIADAIRESSDDIREYVYARPLRVGIIIAVGYGIAVVIGKSLVVGAMQNLYSWELAIAVGAAIGAVAAAPGLFRAALAKVAEPIPPTPPTTQPAHTGPETPEDGGLTVEDPEDPQPTDDPEERDSEELVGCPGCEAEIPASERYCGHCGERVGETAK